MQLVDQDNEHFIKASRASLRYKLGEYAGIEKAITSRATFMRNDCTKSQ